MAPLAMFELSLARPGLARFGSRKGDFRTTAAHEAKSDPLVSVQQRQICRCERMTSLIQPQPDFVINGPSVSILIYFRSECGRQLQFLVVLNDRASLSFSSALKCCRCKCMTIYIILNSVIDSMTSPQHLIEGIIKHAGALVLVHERSHSCDSLQWNSVKSGSNQGQRNVTSHPYP